MRKGKIFQRFLKISFFFKKKKITQQTTKQNAISRLNLLITKSRALFLSRAFQIQNVHFPSFNPGVAHGLIPSTAAILGCLRHLQPCDLCQLCFSLTSCLLFVCVTPKSCSPLLIPALQFPPGSCSSLLAGRRWWQSVCVPVEK